MSIYITREMVWQAAQDSRHDQTETIFDQMSRWVARQWLRRSTISQLRALSDSQLTDIGITRAEIPHVVDLTLDEQPGMERPAAWAMQHGRAGHAKLSRLGTKYRPDRRLREHLRSKW